MTRPLTMMLLLLQFTLNVGRADETETKITELAPGVFFRKAQTKPEFTGCNQGWIEFKDFVVVVDANFPNQAKKVIALIKKHTDKPIKYVFDTHHHGDHADGNIHYKRLGATIIGSHRGRPLFQTSGPEGFDTSKKTKPDEYGPLKYEQPSLYFHDKLILDDGTQRVEFLYFGHGHTLGDAVAWLPRQKILFTGDACVNGAFNYTGQSNTESWITVLNRMLELPIKTLAPGHGELGDKSIITTQRRYFVELRSYIQKAIDQGKKLDEIKKEIDLPFYKKWTGVDVKTREENIEHVYGELAGDN